jgi:hypothetical protein
MTTHTKCLDVYLHAEAKVPGYKSNGLSAICSTDFLRTGHKGLWWWYYIQLPYPESPYYKFSVRLTGFDAPEIKGRSEEERAAAHSSQKALEDLILTPLHF